jgi:hypothetical protein
LGVFHYDIRPDAATTTPNRFKTRPARLAGSIKVFKNLIARSLKEDAFITKAV